MQVSTCGAAGCGQLLDGSTQDRCQMVRIPDLFVMGVRAGGVFTVVRTETQCVCWSEGCPGPVELTTNPVSEVACGWTHALLLIQGEVYSWGEGKQGQLGLGEVTYAQQPRKVTLSTSVSSISCGFRTSFVLGTYETYCFGDNKKHQLGLPTGTKYLTPTLHPFLGQVSVLSSGLRHSVAVLPSKELYVWGENDYGQLGLPSPASVVEPMHVSLPEITVKRVYCGWFHTIILTETGEIYLTGKGDLGEQGNGHWDHCHQFHQVLSEIVTVCSGSEHILAVSREGLVYSWGWNEHGNLGLGDTVNRCRPTVVSGVCGVKDVAAAAAVSYVCC